MGPRGDERGTELVDDGTPEDVAALYRWANLTGAKYRDYSAERREQRARTRYRAAKQQLELGVPGEQGTEASGAGGPEVRQTGLVARASLRALEEEREIAQAHESAQRKQRAVAEAERLRRERTGYFAEETAGPAKPAETHAAAKYVSDLISRVETPPIVQAAVERSLAAIRPAWLEYAAESSPPENAPVFTNPAEPRAPEQAARSSMPETLLESREQVALRWPALQALALELRSNGASVRVSLRRGPIVAIISPAGGAGGTSLAAMVARALARSGERVLLVQSTPQSLLPLYFGHERVEVGELRKVVLREGGIGAVSITAIDATSFAGADTTESHMRRMQEAAIEELLIKAQDCNRVVIDVAPEAVWTVRRLARLRPMVLAPIAPEMSSVAGLRAMEQTFAAIRDRDGGALLPFYVLNRFDAGLPLHLDIREVLRRELDERLLAVAVRRSAVVGEALAQGTTVLDYAPDSPVARDYAEVARWLQAAAPASANAIADLPRGVR
jgi:cellulose synthase operon protein YhjQ